MFVLIGGFKHENYWGYRWYRWSMFMSLLGVGSLSGLVGNINSPIEYLLTKQHKHQADMGNPNCDFSRLSCDADEKNVPSWHRQRILGVIPINHPNEGKSNKKAQLEMRVLIGCPTFLEKIEMDET